MHEASNANPVAYYLANLSEGSQNIRQPLDTIAKLLDDKQNAESYPWHTVAYRDSMTLKLALAQRYKPATVNKML